MKTLIISSSLSKNSKSFILCKKVKSILTKMKINVDRLCQLAGEGASSRNSGYLVETTLNDGFTSNKELTNYKKKSRYL